MRVLLTGGSGDLGQMVCSSLTGMGHTPVVFDMQPLRAEDAAVEFIQGSILDREKLSQSMENIDIVVHIAAWHGIHEVRHEKTVYEFFDLNVTGTFNVFQAACDHDIKDLVFISSTSIDERFGVYGHTKVLGEEIATTYAHRHGMNVITLRPRAFIPPWNRHVYTTFIDWAKWYAKGAVHISDVSQSVIKSIELLASKEHQLQNSPVFLTVDGAYQYTQEDLDSWDHDGPGTTFMRHYKPFYDLAIQSGLDPSLKPHRLDISETQNLLNYKPLYSMKTLLLELKMYGPEGPYAKRRF